MFMLLALLPSNSPIIFKISAVSHCDMNIVLMLRGILGLAKNLVKSWFITAESLFFRVEKATLVFRFLAIYEKKVLKPSAILCLSVTRLPSTINDALKDEVSLWVLFSRVCSAVTYISNTTLVKSA